MDRDRAERQQVAAAVAFTEEDTIVVSTGEDQGPARSPYTTLGFAMMCNVGGAGDGVARFIREAIR